MPGGVAQQRPPDDRRARWAWAALTDASFDIADVTNAALRRGAQRQPATRTLVLCRPGQRPRHRGRHGGRRAPLRGMAIEP
jgi:hypothetical protein